MPAENRAVAELLTRGLTRHGGYDVTFFDNLTYEHLAPPSRQPTSTASQSGLGNGLGTADTVWP
jgi:hypothetical protein